MEYTMILILSIVVLTVVVLSLVVFLYRGVCNLGGQRQQIAVGFKVPGVEANTTVSQDEFAPKPGIHLKGPVRALIGTIRLKEGTGRTVEADKEIVAYKDIDIRTRVCGEIGNPKVSPRQLRG